MKYDVKIGRSSDRITRLEEEVKRIKKEQESVIPHIIQFLVPLQGKALASVNLNGYIDDFLNMFLVSFNYLSLAQRKRFSLQTTVFVAVLGELDHATI